MKKKRRMRLQLDTFFFSLESRSRALPYTQAGWAKSNEGRGNFAHLLPNDLYELAKSSVTKVVLLPVANQPTSDKMQDYERFELN